MPVKTLSEPVRVANGYAVLRVLEKKAFELGGEDYRLIASAAYRHTIGAHKLIADERGDMIFLSKENDSNGCIGTVDVSYPSIPLFLLYNPEYVRSFIRKNAKKYSVRELSVLFGYSDRRIRQFIAEEKRSEELVE